MEQKNRELLVTATVAQHWSENFEQKVDELIEILDKVDTENAAFNTCELFDVYKKSRISARNIRKRKKKDRTDKPFEFLVYRN